MADTKPSKAVEDLHDKLRKPRKDAEGVVPSVRKGEDSMSSRPFSLLRLIGARSGILDADHAKAETDLIGRFNKALDETGAKASNTVAGSFFYPGQLSLLKDDAADHPATRELLQSAVSGPRADPDEVAWLAERTGRVQKGYGPQYVKTAMSYLTDTIGGALVPPPEMGELIPLMRNKSALDRAGARQVPLPPNGKWVAPRVTGPSTGYWIGENTAPTESNPTTGQVTMQAKKLAVLVRVPNELFKFTSAGADALLRDDVTKTLALGFDYAGLYGAGGGGQPKGIINYTDSNEALDYAGSTPTPTGVATNGNTLNPEDGYRMASAIADRNFDADGTAFKWIMRPKMWGAIASRRGDAVAAGDGAGVFVQSLTRILGDAVGKEWCGHEVVQSSQVRNNQTKGSGTGLTEVFGGVFGEFLMGLYGAIEFASNPMGDTSFQQDQTLIRGILHGDCVPRYPGAFVYYKQLVIG